jgi:hypothetical protein
MSGSGISTSILLNCVTNERGAAESEQGKLGNFAALAPLAQRNSLPLQWIRVL